ncbi:MAG: transcription initiation factor IIF, beta subunit-domain-containing protein, partial [Olpidium bornovanus]
RGEKKKKRGGGGGGGGGKTPPGKKKKKKKKKKKRKRNILPGHLPTSPATATTAAFTAQHRPQAGAPRPRPVPAHVRHLSRPMAAAQVPPGGGVQAKVADVAEDVEDVEYMEGEDDDEDDDGDGDDDDDGGAGETDGLFGRADLKMSPASSSDGTKGDSRKRPAEETLEPDVTKLTTPVWALKSSRDRGVRAARAVSEGVAKPDASIILSDAAVNRGLPKEYKLTVLETSRKSLYAFSEREDGESRYLFAGTHHSSLLPACLEGDLCRLPESQPTEFRCFANDPPPPFPPGLKLGTVEINGVVATECEAQPVMCAELRQILEKREQEQAVNKAPILLTNEEMKPNAIVPGGQTLSLPLAVRLLPAPDCGSVLPLRATPLRSSRLARKPPTKQQILESKTARMPKNELLDLLFAAFERYQLWSFKGILEYVRQPISYTREVLQEVAVLHKKGEHTGKYELKPEFRKGGAGAAAAREVKEKRSPDEGEEEFVESGEESEERTGGDEESSEEDEFEEVE